MTGFDTNLLDQVVAFYNEVLSLSVIYRHPSGRMPISLAIQVTTAPDSGKKSIWWAETRKATLKVAFPVLTLTHGSEEIRALISGGRADHR
jgi:hypothetical protein